MRVGGLWYKPILWYFITGMAQDSSSTLTQNYTSLCTIIITTIINNDGVNK